ncbi:fatty acid desaturase [Pseudidiomarina terrestris]|uniref:Fatty acid desaturase n=1 Tax=Pseudidiomarina terrestris TaxID=2820060 RepID=A0AAW7R4E6_9GAMM|nr:MULTISPECIES: fatty acid desaturase [unclassified Pseudidiomarina]MDN7125545.1 fatty acid desaturase [Pseudidiomarina sp. 1APP75-32.1]MDN7130592.1 fatty acid desaturase [Pseudidiomarina sp. 1APR75-15]MDN7134233.1 fatty acid desaturase [Pseudidiomarina sp. 1ASP75-5]MDN7137079.1 fatty acid desaturase [Pseudidiomarina sp. 1ASP75-14]
MSTSQSAKPKIIWLNTLVFTITFLVAAIGVPWYGLTHGFSFGLWLALIGTIGFAGISITAGYHRLWAHRTYDAHWSLRVLFALGGALAVQNSALHWSSDHREHHKHVDDNDKDPYSAKRGFWYSHIGWMLREYQASRYHDYNNVKDLQKDGVVMWQHRHYLTLTLLTTIGWPVAIGLMLGDVWGAVILVGFARLVINHHTTFFINSLAHIWGKQTYTDRNTARDNGFLAFLTFGEGYHNYHHIFSADYRNGIRWWQFDPTKWLIRGCSWLGLTRNLKRTHGYQVEKAKLEMQFKKLTAKAPISCETTMQKLHDEYDALLLRLREYYQARKQLLDSKTKALAEHMPTLEEMHEKVAELRNAFLQHKRQFKMLLQQPQIN